MTRRILWPLLCFALAACALSLPACTTDGHFTLGGYSTRPNYDPDIRTVRLPIFKNRSPWVATPAVGMEMDLTRTVIREIEQKTPFKIVQDCGTADTELRGTIVGFRKYLLNYTQFNGVREAEVELTVALIWRDLRTGKILSRPPRRPFEPQDAPPRGHVLATPDSLLPPGSKPMPLRTDALTRDMDPDEDYPIDPRTNLPITPVLVVSTGRYIPEVGGSITTAEQQAYDRLAVQIVSLMETGW